MAHFSRKPFGLVALALAIATASLRAENPVSFYVFPAGGQKGTEVEFRVGGAYFHGGADFHLVGEGLAPGPRVEETDTIWFDPPRLHEPLSSQKEDYPLDHLGKVKIGPKTLPGSYLWHCQTVQGLTEPKKFIIGDFPEVVEAEIEGDPIPEAVQQLPVTINGRIFPIEDVDLWDFDAPAGETLIIEVVSTQLGYALQPMLEISGPDGNLVKPEQSLNGDDPTFWFTPKNSGRHRIKICDARFMGHQSFVYRLTVKTGPHPTSIFPLGGRRGEALEAEVNGLNMEPEKLPVVLSAEDAFTAVSAHGRTLNLHVSELSQIIEGESVELSLPSIGDGRILAPGETDSWFVDLAEKETIQLDIIAAQIGSQLDSSIRVFNDEGRQLSENDDKIAGQLDSTLAFTSPKAGRYEIRISDQYETRGGPEFGYRLKVTKPDPHEFQLTLSKPQINVTAQQLLAEGEKPKRVRGTGIELEMIKSAAFQTDLTLKVTGLPEGVTMSTDKLQWRRPKLEIYFDAPPDLEPQLAEIRIRGTAEIILDKKTKETKTVVREATIAMPFGEPAPDKLTIAFAPYVPFRHLGLYNITNDVPAGSTLTKHYKIIRDGYDGPVTVRLSERQGRNLQGITGPVMELPAGATEFVYPAQHPAGMELGRTTRVQLMVQAEVPDAKGKPQILSYTSFERHNQIMSIAANGWLSLSASKPNVIVSPGKTLTVPLRILRGPQIAGRPLRIELVAPAHMQGIEAESIEIAGDAENAELTLKFGESPGPLNAPIRIRATTADDNPDRHLAETTVELLPVVTETARAEP